MFYNSAVQLRPTVYVVLIFCRKHEWVKHGTCSDFPDEHSFFAAVLKRYETLGFGSELAQYITPSKQGRNVSK